MDKNEYLTTDKKVKILIEKLKLKNLIDFSNSIVDGKYNRALGLSCGRIKNFNKFEIDIMEKKYNVNKNWLLFGNGPIFQIFTKDNLEEFILKLEVIDDTQNVINGYYIDKRFFGQIIDGKEQYLFIFIVKDDSMKNTYSKNDLLLCYDYKCNQNKKDLEDGIYLLKINNRLILRRLTNSIHDMINVTTDNEISIIETLKIEELTAIYAKVIKTIRID